MTSTVAKDVLQEVLHVLQKQGRIIQTDVSCYSMCKCTSHMLQKQGRIIQTDVSCYMPKCTSHMCYKNKDGLSKLWCELLCVNIPPTWVWCQSWKDEYHCGHSVLRVVQRSYRRTRTAPPKESIKKQAKRTTEMLKCLLGSDDGRKEGG